MSDAQDKGLEHIARVGLILSGIHEAAAYEHVLVLLIRPVEAAVVHVPPDGSAWFGTERSPESLREMREFARNIATNDEHDVTALAQAFEPAARGVPAKELLAGVLWSLAEPISCELAVILARDGGDAPAWLAARYEEGKVTYMETQPDAFNRELLRLHDFADQDVNGGSMPKPSLRAADVGSSYTLPISPEMKMLIEAQDQAFREKFGREPGPGDPLFFDPEADTPQPLSPEKIRDLEAQMAEHGFNEEWFIRNQAHLEEEGLLRREGRKQGRNDPCWCGSGKKYKRCHGA